MAVGAITTIDAENHQAVSVPVLLVSMPFFTARMPSLQLGLLSAIGKASGYVVDTLHLNLDFAVRVGPAFYEELCVHRGPEIGNWLFATEAFRAEAPDREGRLAFDFPDAMDFLGEFDLDELALCRMREDMVPAFLTHAETAIDWPHYKVVGFTSTFQQNTASFALARRLKERFPRLITVFGGANFEGEMGRELVRTCPWIDYAVDGEADEAFPAFVRALALGKAPTEIPGVISRERGEPHPPRPLSDLASLPIPDYEEFFQRAEELGLVKSGQRDIFDLPFESSRGCWWGQKHHCTFCGLNGATMTFRQKTTERVTAELGELARRYGVFRFCATDNIMPSNFFKDFVPGLAAQGSQYDLFFEMKANLSRVQIKALREAGIRYIQPGIESLSTHVLRLMRKGTRAAQNVNLLRWARYYGVDLMWNLIWGFPDEREADYREQTALLPHLVHLQPPKGAGRIWLGRFSPHFFDRRRFPVQRLEPEASLAYIYPPHIEREKIAYFFNHTFKDELPATVFDPIVAQVEAWQDAWDNEQRPWLTYRWTSGLLHVEDGRDLAAPILYKFDSPLAEIYSAITDRPLNAGAVREALDLPWSANDIAEALDLLAVKGLVMRDEELFLALAIPATAAEKSDALSRHDPCRANR